MKDRLALHEDVEAALARGAAIVALESTLMAHGLPSPENLEVAVALRKAVLAAGAVPATVAVLDGIIRIGLEASAVQRLVTAELPKTNAADLAAVLGRRGNGATTVSATMRCAQLAGIRLLGTGGIGGVHRNAAETFDLSTDLYELARTPVAVVCSGAKSVLDLPATLEVLESLGVPVLGYRTNYFPAFHARSSGLPLEHRVDTAEEVAAVAQAHWELGGAGIVVANPVPEEAAIDWADLEALVDRALAESVLEQVTGKDITPFLLARLADLSEGATVRANVALVEANAGLAAEVACALAAPD